ncbi:MAG: hypothetical protein E7292_03360 [Lachnospiraceae bacterium]|nr:hypothetical protein [Lachnospiraceae bacterium]
MIHNLKEICKRMDREKYVVKVPLIPEYSNERDVAESVEMLRQMGVECANILPFEYQKIG